jgi:hypothetical protein
VLIPHPRSATNSVWQYENEESGQGPTKSCRAIVDDDDDDRCIEGYIK